MKKSIVLWGLSILIMPQVLASSQLCQMYAVLDQDTDYGVRFNGSFKTEIPPQIIEKFFKHPKTSVYCFDASHSTLSRKKKNRNLEVQAYLPDAESIGLVTVILILDNCNPATFLKSKTHISTWNGGPEIFDFYYKVKQLRLIKRADQN